jgi:hypothetical protein
MLRRSTADVHRVATGRQPSSDERRDLGIETKLVSHTEPGCKYPCKRYLLYPRLSKQPEPWNVVVKTMRKGEVRRVWLGLPERNKTVVYEIELASVVRTDRAGEPIIETR